MSTPDQWLAEVSAHINARRFSQAAVACRAVLKLQPGHAQAHYFLGLTQFHIGEHAAAGKSFVQALRFDAKHAGACIYLGRIAAMQGRLDDAAQHYFDAITHNPSAKDAYFQLGRLFHLRAQTDDAIGCYRQALLLDATHAESHANMGLCLLLKGQLKDAAASLEFALKLNPNLPNAHDGLGMLAESRGDDEAAITQFDQALGLDPHYMAARLNRGVTRLRRGEILTGIADWDARFDLSSADNVITQTRRPFRQPLWQGEALNGKPLLVWGEQGVGDEIRTAGLVADLAERGEKIVLECDARLEALLGRSLPSVEIVGRMTPPVKATTNKTIAYQIPAENLIGFIRPTLEAFPKRPRYLMADELKTRQFKARLAAKNALPKIGLSWGSYNPNLIHGKTSALMDWAPVLRTKKKHFIDLQYGETRAERDAAQNKLGVELTHLPDLDLKADLDGLAALISACDLVITVSNTTAHLAGALGVPTWVLLPFGHFQPWYWFSGRADSPWYPSVRLYRQQKFGDWANVIARVADDLKALKP
ncbi:MAG: tetratricopeptide repeat protein [Rhodospirillaceae bacterium]|nr:tetratricopeptide repeat protein [Rhodospirillaceae bacterium]